jgi:hypothetical protein
MKKVFISIILLPFLAFTCDSVEKQTDWLQGKVVRVSCASFIVQVLNNDTIGEDGWKDMMNNNAAYDNVFNAGNKCAIPEAIKAGSTIRFKIAPPAKNDCVTCMMFDGPPQAKYDIKEVTLVDNK